MNRRILARTPLIHPLHLRRGSVEVIGTFGAVDELEAAIVPDDPSAILWRLLFRDDPDSTLFVDLSARVEDSDAVPGMVSVTLTESDTESLSRHGVYELTRDGIVLMTGPYTTTRSVARG